MKFTEAVYSKAEAELKKRRENAEELAALRRRNFISEHPELKELENEIRDAALAAVRSVGSGQNPDISALAAKNLAAQEKRRLLVKSAGFPEDYLEPHYSCPLCKDTGIFDGKLCECHLRLLKKIASSELSCSPLLASSTFGTFDLSFYSDKKDPALGYSPREYMRAAVALIKNFADSFSRTSGSLLFCGSTGLGKTHLALAVMNELTEKGHNCLYYTAWKLLKRMQDEHFGRDDGSLSEELSDGELLIIDDLGSEYETPFSKAAVYELINESQLIGRPMIICTGLSLSQLEERYGQKVASRLNAFEIVSFTGSDIRQLKK